MKPIVIIFAHPSPKRSKLNLPLIRAARSLDHVEVRDLYELYPNLHIDAQAEQDVVRQAKAIVFQFPIHWFSAPAILKEWQDTVLTSSFAYGIGERALEGKCFMLVASSGGSASSYSQRGRHGASLASYLAPFEQTARFCGMKPQENFIVQNAGDLAQYDLVQLKQAYKDRLTFLGK